MGREEFHFHPVCWQRHYVILKKNGLNFIVVEEEETEIRNPLDQASFKMDVAHLYGYFHCLVRHGKVIWANHV